ncbi:hypothetical protein GC173_16960 [bacterium]|nr:hypothetical protein [bacterium]
MELRPPAKIAIGVVGALGTIAALHFTVFASRADAYAKAKQSYESAIDGYRNAGRTPDIQVINLFRYETLRQKLEFWQTMKNLNFYLPDFYATGDVAIISASHRKASWDIMRKLIELRREGEAGNGPKLTFLTGNRGAWNLVESLPQEMIQRGIVVEDALSDLRDEDRLLNSLAPGSRQFLDRTNNYNRKLAALGLDVNYRNGLKEYMGQQVATFYTLNRIDQVLQKLPEDYFGVGAGEQEKLDQLYKLFRIEWPKDKDGNESPLIAQRQAEALLNLIGVAKDKGIKEITYVKLERFGELRWEDFDPAAAAAATPTPAPAMNMDEFNMDMDFDPGMGMGAGGGRFDTMGGGGGAAAPVEKGEPVGLNAPIQMYIRGTNSSIIEFMYAVTKSQNPLEIDRARLRNISPADGTVEAQLYINVIAYANFAGVTNGTDIERMIVEFQRQLAEVSLRVGAREAAEKDGLVVLRDGRHELATPSPTPHPASKAEEPPPPPNDGMGEMM